MSATKPSPQRRAFILWLRVVLAMFAFRAHDWLLTTFLDAAAHPYAFRVGASWLGASVVLAIFTVGVREVDGG